MKEPCGKEPLNMLSNESNPLVKRGCDEMFNGETESNERHEGVSINCI
jgi:hypothetical protein